MGDFAFWFFITVIVVLFYGEPDLHSVLVQHLTTK